jgi:site-specific DNA-methyltransferase (adenine-specific)
MDILLDGKVLLHGGDCLDVLPTLSDNAIDACLTDPPYHLASIVKRFGKEGSAPAKSDGASGVYKRASAGFMGKQWDGGDVAFDPATWRQVLRVLKPGAHLAAFGAPKNVHRLTCAIEDAGFEIRDVVMWLYGQGFPKSHDVAKRLAKSLDYGEDGEAEKERMVEHWEGWGTALKPAYEPIILARKPLIGTVATNVLAYGTGAINIDACRVEGENPSIQRRASAAASGNAPGHCGEYTHTINDRSSPEAYLRERPGEALGRWPANVAHDGCIPTRFFYCAKATADERIASKHPTVKPIALLRWLARMICRPDGVILDPFAGTGTTGEAAVCEGMRAVLIEREEDSQADIHRRMKMLMMGPQEREHALRLVRGEVEPFEETELGRAA